MGRTSTVEELQIVRISMNRKFIILLYFTSYDVQEIRHLAQGIEFSCEESSSGVLVISMTAFHINISIYLFIPISRSTVRGTIRYTVELALSRIQLDRLIPFYFAIIGLKTRILIYFKRTGPENRGDYLIYTDRNST